jgi:DNA-binding transcriptional MerR regulator
MQTDNSSQDLMLSIEQVSQLTGVRKSTLRYWEKSFEEFLKPARTQSNRREYTMEDLNLVKTIKRLLEEEHLTPEGVRLMLLKMFPPQVTKRNSKKGADNKRGELGCSGPIPLHANTKL